MHSWSAVVMIELTPWVRSLLVAEGIPVFHLTRFWLLLFGWRSHQVSPLSPASSHRCVIFDLLLSCYYVSIQERMLTRVTNEMNRMWEAFIKHTPHFAGKVEPASDPASLRREAWDRENVLERIYLSIYLSMRHTGVWSESTRSSSSSRGGSSRKPKALTLTQFEYIYIYPFCCGTTEDPWYVLYAYWFVWKYLGDEMPKCSPSGGGMSASDKSGNNGLESCLVS